MKSETLKTKFVLAAAILICSSLSISTLNAQTTKRRISRAAAPTVAPTPTMESLPIIVSRAEDVPNENRIPVSEPIAQPPPESMDEKIDQSNKRIKELNTRLKSLESTQKNEYDEKQKRLLLNLDILSRSEQRAESLRKQLFDIIEKESTVKSKLDQIQFDSRTENVERSAAFAGSLRPEELRDQRKKSLDAERKNLETLLTQIQNNRAVLEQSVEKADQLVEKVRSRMEKEIDDALADDKP